MTLILIAALALLMAGSEPAMAGEGGGLDPCTAWAYGACGAGGCAPATRQWTRTCDPGEGPTAECRNDSSCCFYEDAPEGCGQGSCASTARRYKRTSNVPGCTPVSHWCQNEGSCGYVPPPPP
ncbi:MAG: hypothetical protein HYW10_04415, partial [Candidatus Omnitrophica bacterium]|nr:hypothetical protein [Candidatus Omnitrophota bacterium]